MEALYIVLVLVGLVPLGLLTYLMIRAVFNHVSS